MFDNQKYASLMMLLLATPGCIERDTSSPSGEKRTVRQHEEFTIELASNPTTGYSWHLVAFDEHHVKMVKDKYFRREEVAVRPGMGGVDIFTFQAQKPGTTQITLEYKRAWEKEKPIKEYTVELTIEE